MKMYEVQTPIVTQYFERSSRTWENRCFKAGLFSFQGWHRLSIWRWDEADQTPFSWETLQEIKSACGFGHMDAVEVYPRDSDVMNTANARHLYLMDSPLPFAMRIKPQVLPQSNPPVNGDENA